MAELDAKDGKNPSRARLTVSVGVIRDGTQGISLSMGRNVIGEWTDSRARTLSLTNNFKVAICGEDRRRIYLFSVPGKILSGEQVSDTEVSITFEME